jgi:hypothetical protein
MPIPSRAAWEIARFISRPVLRGAKRLSGSTASTFTGAAGERDLEIVDGGGAVQGEARDIAAAHQVQQHGARLHLMTAAHAPEEARAPARRRESINARNRRLPEGGANEQAGDTAAAGRRKRNRLLTISALLQTNRFQVGEIERPDRVTTHARTLRRASR